VRSHPTALRGPLRQAVLLAVLSSALLSGTSHGQDKPAAPPPLLAGSLYFDPWQLEKEFVISPLALQQWLDLGLTPGAKLDAARREALKPGIGEFLGKRCPVTIEGTPVEFTLDRMHFIEPVSTEFVLIEPEAVVAVEEIRISAVYAAPNTDLTSRLQVIWDLFPEGQASVPVAAADVVGTRLFRLAPVAPSFTIMGRYELGAGEAPKAPPAPERVTLQLPWLSIVLILCAVVVGIRIVRSEKPGVVAVVVLLALAGGAAAARKFATLPIPHPFSRNDAIDAEQTSAILDGLLRGVYHAFDYHDKSEQYDVLAKVVAGEALTEIYLEVQRTLESRARDGARVRVNGLTVEESTPAPLKDRRGFETEGSWQVRGRVGHWGHFHDRTNRYRATIVVEPVEQTWKITGLHLHARDREPAPTP